MSVQQANEIRLYRHTSDLGLSIELPVGKVVCVGRNYMDHVQEMSNKVSDIPLLFMKPSTAIADMREDITFPSGQGECHNELEVALLIGRRLTKVLPDEASFGVCGIGLGLDLTLRQEQSRLKDAGQPWERAKAFDGSCPLSPFVQVENLAPESHHKFELKINGNVVQSGDTKLMLTPMLSLISEISQHFTLLPGDVVLTGTPKGVGPLHAGDNIVATLDNKLSVSSKVVASKRESQQ